MSEARMKLNALFAHMVSIVIVFLSSVVRAQPETQDPTFGCAHRIRQLSMAVAIYAQRNDGHLPPDLAATIDYFGQHDPKAADIPGLIRSWYISPGAEDSVKVPDDAPADWVNENSSYAYLGRPGVNFKDLPDWGSVAIAHLKLDQPHAVEVSDQNPEGALYTATFLDAHSEILTRAALETVIAQSNQILDAAATGAPFPDQHQVIWNLAEISKAIRAYIAANDGHLPPDLGAVLEHVAPDDKRLKTPADRARIFLTPHVARNIFIPEEPTPEWVTRNTSFVYLGDAALIHSHIDDQDRLILLHARFDAPIEANQRGTMSKVIPTLDIRGNPDLSKPAWAEHIASESREVLSALKSGRPLPDYHHTLRDLRLLKTAAEAYAKAHEGNLPPDLAATLDYLPADELPTPAEKANVYFSPRAQRARGDAPEPLDPDWIRAHANYTYLGAGRTLKWLNYSSERLVIHAPLDEVYEIRHPGFSRAAVPYASGRGPVWAESPESLEKMIAEQKSQS
jgi:hypothetical protein